MRTDSCNIFPQRSEEGIHSTINCRDSIHFFEEDTQLTLQIVSVTRNGFDVFFTNPILNSHATA